MIVSKVKRTSWAVTGRPSLQRAAGSIRKVKVRLSVEIVQPSASPGRCSALTGSMSSSDS